ncbi:hypothetical protein HN51_065326 [Arachis hypogaea]
MIQLRGRILKMIHGVACNQEGLVVNISLQGKGLSGSIPTAISSLKSLTGLYLHFNSLSGILPKEISSLTHLTDLCLNVNSLSGDIPRQIANLSNLQVITSQIRQTAEYFSDLTVLLDLSSENGKIWWSNFDNKTSS